MLRFEPHGMWEVPIQYGCSLATMVYTGVVQDARRSYARRGVCHIHGRVTKDKQEQATLMTTRFPQVPLAVDSLDPPRSLHT